MTLNAYLTKPIPLLPQKPEKWYLFGYNYKMNLKYSFYKKAPIQFKLTIGSPDDPLEAEANAMADTVMRMPDQNFIQRKCSDSEEEEKV